MDCPFFVEDVWCPNTKASLLFFSFIIQSIKLCTGCEYNAAKCVTHNQQLGSKWDYLREKKMSNGNKSAMR